MCFYKSYIHDSLLNAIILSSQWIHPYPSSIKEVHDFEWESQLRFYWVKEHDSLFVRQCNTSFSYGYEYMGLNGRLAITPLTSRIYLTLTQVYAATQVPSQENRRWSFLKQGVYICETGSFHVFGRSSCRTSRCRKNRDRQGSGQSFRPVLCGYTLHWRHGHYSKRNPQKQQMRVF